MSETRRGGIWRRLAGIYRIANWGGNSFRPVQGDYTGRKAAVGHGPDALHISQQRKSQSVQAQRSREIGPDAHDRDQSLRMVAGNTEKAFDRPKKRMKVNKFQNMN